MDAPVLRHRSLGYLLKEFRTTALGRRLLALPPSLVGMGLIAPASIAWWLKVRRPELLSKPELRIALLGAGQLDSADDGRWYNALPWLLGNEALKTRITLVGPHVRGGDDLDRSIAGAPKTQLGTPALAGRLLEAVFPPARLATTSAAAYIKGAPDRDDLYVLFQPGFESFEEAPPQWFDQGQLDVVVEANTPIALFAYGRLEQITEEWLVKKFGFEVVGTATENPFTSPESPGGRWAAVGWELATQPRVGDRPTDEQLVPFDEYSRYAQPYYEAQERSPQDVMGCIEAVRISPGGQFLDLVCLADAGVWADPSTGALYQKQEGVTEEVSLRVPQDHCLLFPGHTADNSFERAAWAMGAYSLALTSFDEGDVEEDADDLQLSLSEMLRTSHEMTKMQSLLEGRDDEGRVFPEDIKEQMDNYVSQLAGKHVSADDYLEQMRLEGGVHGPTAFDWYNLLSNLDWKMTNEVEDPVRFEPAFYAHTSDGSVRLPVVCENYAYIPGDVDDKLANQAKTELASRYPGGVLLMFKAVMCKQHQGQNYSFGGLYYKNEQWRQVALCLPMKGLEAVLAQVDEGFTFNAPDPKYIDKGCTLARALNFLTHGADPNNFETPAISMRNGDWISIIPDEQGLSKHRR